MACYCCAGEFEKKNKGFKRKSLGASLNKQTTVREGLQALCYVSLEEDVDSEFVCLQCFSSLSKGVNKITEAKVAQNDLLKRLGVNSKLGQKRTSSVFTPTRTPNPKKRFKIGSTQTSCTKAGKKETPQV